MLFDGTLQKGKELRLVEALIQAGADLNFNKNGMGETPLTGAASLGAEDVGLCLLDAGAKPELRGLTGETALHGAALLGEDRLATRLIHGPDVNLKDVKYSAPPLGRAVHGWCNPLCG
jgi:ankyrin repeat protein